MASNIAKLGGYNPEIFEQPPPDDLICLICTLVAKDPHQVTCCGKIYCRDCLVEQKKISNVCPNCREGGNSFEDKKSNRIIKELRVKCDNSGCLLWKGELRKLNDHHQVCQFQMLQCPNECMKKDKQVELLRKDLAEHLKSQCPNRIIKCRVHCKEEGKYIDITTTHLEVCPKMKIPCTNESCLAQIPRDMLFKHRLMCPYERLPCKYFPQIGCPTELLRQDRKSHESNDQLHLHLAIETIFKMQSGLVNTSTAQNGFTFKMTNFDNHKTKDMRYYSPPFYTNPGGYKMCLEIHSNGWVEGYKKSVSVFVYFMRGENDDILQWPFTGTVTIELLNQLQDDNHYKDVTEYGENKSDTTNNRVTEGDRASKGYGPVEYISHGELGHNPALNRQYLKDDCLFFRVTVDGPQPIKPWLTCSN